MGWEWEVEAYVLISDAFPGGTYGWVPVYQGDSQDAADHARLKAAGEGFGAIRTTWRPS